MYASIVVTIRFVKPNQNIEAMFKQGQGIVLFSSSLADNEKARQICCGRGLDGRILIALSDTGSVHVLDLDPAKVRCNIKNSMDQLVCNFKFAEFPSPKSFPPRHFAHVER